MRTNPAAPLVTGTVFRVSVYYLTDNNTQINTFDYMGATPTATPVADQTAISASFQTNVIPQLRLVTTAQTTIVQITIADISVGRTVTDIVPIGLAGTVAGDSLPLEMQANIRKLSLLKGQHGYGRVQMPAVPISFTTPATDPNRINAAGVAAYVLLGNEMLVSPVSGAVIYNPCISTRVKQPLPPAPPISSLVTRAQIYILCFPEPLMGSQRRRRPGRGI